MTNSGSCLSLSESSFHSPEKGVSDVDPGTARRSVSPRSREGTNPTNKMLFSGAVGAETADQNGVGVGAVGHMAQGTVGCFRDFLTSQIKAFL